MKNINSCTALIPFYNEEGGLVYTLTQLAKVKAITKIICINDGSTDSSESLIRNSFPHVQIVTLPQNIGKAGAIKKGISRIDTSLVMLFDADLKNIVPDEIEAALIKIKTSKYDMIILRRIIESRFLSLIRHDVVMSGQRILKTKDLNRALKNNPKGYELETAINQFMIHNQKKVCWMPLSTLNPLKHTKHKLLTSIKLYAQTALGYFVYIGPMGYFYQIFNFCKMKCV